MFPKAAAFATNTQLADGPRRAFATGRRHSRVSGAPEVFGEFPATCMAEEIETPGDVRSARCWSSVAIRAVRAEWSPRRARV
jgi:hypothetical protein